MPCKTLALVLVFVNFAGVGSVRADVDTEEWVRPGRCLPIQANWLCRRDAGHLSKLSKDDKACIAKLCDEQEKSACCDARKALLDSGKAQSNDFAYEGSPGFSMPPSAPKLVSSCLPIHARLLCPKNPKLATVTSKQNSQCIARLCDEERKDACCKVRQALLESGQAKSEDFIPESTGLNPREVEEVSVNEDNDEAVDEYREQPADFSPESSDSESGSEIGDYEEVDDYRDLLSDAGRAAILGEQPSIQQSTTSSKASPEVASPTTTRIIANTEDGEKSTTHEKWSADVRNRFARRFYHITKADLDAAEEKYSDPAEAGNYLLWRNMANRFESKCTEEEVLVALEAHDWDPRPTSVALVGFGGWCTELKTDGKKCDKTSHNNVNWDHYYRNSNAQISQSLQQSGKDLEGHIETCCKRARLDKTTKCDRYTCQRRGKRNREWYYAEQKDVCDPAWLHANTFNRAPINVFSKACPEMPLCREEKSKIGAFVMQDKGRDNSESISNHFDWPGIIESISYETMSSDQSECMFAVFNPKTGETYKLGKLRSGGKMMKPVESAEQLVWWGCEIPPQNLDVYEKQVEEQPDTISLPDMLFPSLRVTYVPSQLPLVGAEFSRKNVKLMMQSRSSGMPLAVTVNVLSGTSWEKRSEVTLKSTGPEKAPLENSYSLRPGQVYRFDITTESGGYVRIYKVSTNTGCPSNEKCCQYKETGKYECAEKSQSFFKKTCAAVPGRVGARNAAGQRSEEGCEYCDADKLLEGIKDDADIRRLKEHGGDLCGGAFQTSSEE